MIMLNQRSKYLQIAFNRSLDEVKGMIAMLPASEKIIIEAGTPLIKRYGKKGITALKDWWEEKLKKLPAVVVLHRGVDENEKNREKQIRHDQIRQIKGTYGKVLISVAGGETTRDVIRTFFNDSDIAVIWRSFYEAPENTAKLAQDFLKLVK